MDTMGLLTVAIDCGNCGFVQGVPEGDNLNRCAECGRFASDNPDVCCLRHELRKSPYPTGECPYCEQERDRRAAIQHEMTRDPTMEPW